MSTTACDNAAQQSSGSVPHGGRLINRLVPASEGTILTQRAARLPRVNLDAREASDLEMIANGALSPFEGFMGRADYERVVAEMRLRNGLPWSLPITLSVPEEFSAPIGSDVALYANDTFRGIIRVDEIFTRDIKHEARNVYGTDEEAHPGVAALYTQHSKLVSGPVTVLPPIAGPLGAEPHDPLRLTPAQSRAEFAQRGWKSIVGFQTRNPVHRAHEYIQKCALEIVDGLFLHPLVGETKSDDIPADVRIRCYKALLENYYPADRVVLATFPAAMRYAGPREAIFHALVRKNYGCTHFIIGRDHAGVGKYYGTYDAQKLFDTFTIEELGITPLKFENSFYCKRCESMATGKTCPHPPENHLTLSGTAVREMLSRGELPPVEFSRPEVAALLA